MARPALGGRSVGGLSQESPMSWGGKLQMMPSPSMKGSSLNSEAIKVIGNSSSGFLGGLGSSTSSKQGSMQKRSQSASQLDAMEVRALAKDKPFAESQDSGSNRSEHGNLMIRLKSREARAKAETNRDFLAQYRMAGGSDSKADDRLDKLLKSTAQRADDLRVKSEELQIEAADAERKLERANAQGVTRMSEQELQAMNPFERSQRRIQEDKREEELQKLRDEAQANYVRVHRRLQNELIELRDYKVLLAEFRRLRLEKLQETLGRVSDGRRLRCCVREMIRHGAQRVLGRLEQAGVPLEPWMREVLVNSCHLELRIEDEEDKLLKLRRQALVPVKGEVHEMVHASKQDRFEALCVRTWDARLRASSGSEQSPGATHGEHAEGSEEYWRPNATHGSVNTTGHSATSGSNVGFRGAMSVTSMQKSASFVTRVPDNMAAEMQSVNDDIAAVKRLLADMRANAAAVISQKMREANKGGHPDTGRDAMDEGFRKLKLLVNEEFAKTTMKELLKSAPQGYGKLAH